MRLKAGGRSEHDEQAALLRWTRLQAGKYPELNLLFAIPNGGNRDARVGARLKAEGVKAGVPDLFLPAPRTIGGRVSHGLFVEMKRKTGRLTPEQKTWIAELQKRGYECRVCYGLDDAIISILEYLEGVVI